MLIRRRCGWEIPEREVLPEGMFRDRRRLLKAMGFTGMIGLSGGLLAGCKDEAGQALAESPAGGGDAGPAADLYPVSRNPRYQVERALTAEQEATTYNNFYEFGSHKNIWRAAQALPTDPWTVRIDGMVEEPFDIDFDSLVRRMPLEERVYRFRCVEAWAMTVPWSGFPLKALVDLARPLGSARYLRMETFLDKEVAPGQREFWYPWPYVEGLTMAEAVNELTFIATGLYGKPIPKQNGAPLRLVAPWKYGFKNVKSIVRFTFTDERPRTFWETVGPSEYGFWANVNPEVAHPRWSQASERLIGTGERVPTLLYNGYGDYVAGLYAGLEDQKLFM